jgi:hypothetical protein
MLRQSIERQLPTGRVLVTVEYLDDGDRVRILEYRRRRNGRVRLERVPHMEGKVVALRDLLGAQDDEGQGGSS